MRFDHRGELAEAVAAIALTGPATYEWCGRARRVVPPGVADTIGPGELRSYLVDRLESELYRNFYVTGSARADDASIPPRRSLIDPMAFVEVLSLANAGCGARTGGWEVVGDEDGLVILRRSAMMVWALPAEVLTNQWPIVVGTTVQVIMPNELRALSPGFYMAVGNRDLSDLPATDPVARLYFNLRSPGAPVFVSAVTSLLNEANLAFRAKVVNDPDAYRRCDAAVLYVRRADLGRLRPMLGQVCAVVAPHLEPDTPAFTFKLAPGIAAADDPGQAGQSFGTNRCALVAEGLVRAYEEGAQAMEDRLDAVEACFVEFGIRPDAPYLSVGVDDPYDELKAALV